MKPITLKRRPSRPASAACEGCGRQMAARKPNVCPECQHAALRANLRELERRREARHESDG